ncbi:MAG: hypothetical protein ACOYWZ_14770 [Bacillota bacterium]
MNRIKVSEAFQNLNNRFLKNRLDGRSTKEDSDYDENNNETSINHEDGEKSSELRKTTSNSMYDSTLVDKENGKNDFSIRHSNSDDNNQFSCSGQNPESLNNDILYNCNRYSETQVNDTANYGLHKCNSQDDIKNNDYQYVNSEPDFTYTPEESVETTKNNKKTFDNVNPFHIIERLYVISINIKN